MTARDLGRRLRGTPLPDAVAARERSWRLVAAAYAEREPALPRRALPRLAALAATLAAALAVGLTPAGAAIGHWVRDVVAPAPARRHVRKTLGPLPGHGRLLALAPSGAWIVQGDGTRRRLGAYDAATWSPRGLFVAVARGRLLAAVDPRGRVRWTLTRPARVTRPAWSPDGFRVAYRSGRELRVVYGDGALDHELASRSGAVTPAWLPRPALHRLAVVDGRGRVALYDTDAGRALWRARAGAPVRQLAWSPGGRRLLVVTGAAVRVLDAAGHTRRVLRAPGARAVAWLPGGRFLLLRSGELRLEPSGRRLLALRDPLTGLVVSPDGRHVLLAAPAAGQWLLLDTAGSRLTVVDGVGRQFDPGGRGPAPLPRPLAWIRQPPP
jgi:hypothetical protein